MLGVAVRSRPSPDTSNKHGQHPAPVVGARHQGIQLRRCSTPAITPGARSRRKSPQREHLQGALSRTTESTQRQSSCDSRQQYFFVCVLDRTTSSRASGYKKAHDSFAAFPDKVGHPAQRYPPEPSRCAELMRVLVDRRRAATGSRAWDITRRTIAFTNATRSCPKRSRRWPVATCLKSLLPAALADHLRDQRTDSSTSGPDPRFPTDQDRRPAHVAHRARATSGRMRMAHVSTVVGLRTASTGSPKLHSDQLLRERVLRRFCRDVARALQQQDQRGDPSALAARWPTRSSAR